MIDIDTAAQLLDDAALRATAIDQLSTSHAFSVRDAYHMQRASIGRREARGERRIGIKLGFTSRAKLTETR